MPSILPKAWLKTVPVARLVIALTVCMLLALLASGIAMAYQWYQQQKSNAVVVSNLTQSELALAQTREEVLDFEASLSALLSQDQYQRNEALQEEIKNIQQVYKQAVERYEELLKLQLPLAQSQPLEKLLTQAFIYLSQRNYSSASGVLKQLDTEIEKQVAVAAPVISAPSIQEAPGNGYRRQQVQTEFGTYVVDVLAADLNSTRVQVETASSGDCQDTCPVASLSEFVSRSGGFAGINGPYFCPAEYPSCAGKTNSFDTLLMNKQKVYFNSDNNVYSTVPAVIFSGNSARFVGQSLEWGRDTSVDAVIAAQPLLLSGGEVRFGGDGDPKKGSKGSRSFIGTKENTVYIGVVRSATVAEVAHVLKAMGLQNALNLDSGGSTAFMANGKYVAGPGRNTPFGIVLVRK